jgi:hypothetical protein
LLPDLVQQGDLADRFLREITELDHRTSPLYHRGALKDQLLMIMEFVEGVTLEQKVSQHRCP